MFFLLEVLSCVIRSYIQTDSYKTGYDRKSQDPEGDYFSWNSALFPKKSIRCPIPYSFTKKNPPQKSDKNRESNDDKVMVCKHDEL